MKYLILLLFAALPALAEPPVVEAIQSTRSGGAWRFDVTLTHPDTGWDHYADGWRIETETGKILGTRELAHPHESEQPFTRSLSGVTVPDGVTLLWIRAKCSVDGWSQNTFKVQLN